MSDAAIERAAEILAKLLPNAISLEFDGEPTTATWPNSFGPSEQAGFRLIARAMLTAPPREVSSE